MSGSTEPRASGAPNKPEWRTRAMNLPTARRMLTLVQRIVDDILTQQGALSQLHPQEERLARHRRELVWPERQRRYRLQEDIAHAENHLHAAVAELDDLGVALLDQNQGRVGFPTLVNERPAFFTWWPGQDGITLWHFAEEERCRPIPTSWESEPVSSSKS